MAKPLLTRRVRLLPILFFTTYLTLTVALFAFGPWPWPVEDGTRLYFFVAAAHISLFVGYLSAAYTRPKGYHGRWGASSLLTLSLVVTLLLILPTSYQRTGRFIPEVLHGIRDPGAAYASSQAWRSGASTIVEYLRIVAGPLLALLLPLTVFYWGKLSKAKKLASLVAIGMNLAIFVAMGTNKLLADYLVLTPWLIAAGVFSRGVSVSPKRKVIYGLAAALAIALFLAFFTKGQMERPGSGALSGYFPITNSQVNESNLLIRWLSLGPRVAATSLSCYVTHGYYGLYLSLEKPFVPMWGVGNSMFLYRNAAKITGMEEIEEMPYPVRIEEDGWDAYGKWSTIYPWIASDVSFPGTVLVVFLIGRLLALAWLDTLRGENPFAVGAFAQLAIMVYYFPANNQSLQSGESLTGFYAILLSWLITRGKYVWGSRHGVLP
jgi:hypothetical protein